MAKINKCVNCNQFDVEAYNEGDLVCARCKKALDKGVQELPDRQPQSKQEKTDPGNSEGGNDEGKEN